MFDTSKIGHSFPPFPVTIERTKLKELAQAIGDNNPIYLSKEEAQLAGYPHIPFLPTTGTIFMFWENTHLIEQLAELGLDVTRLLHREETYEYLAPLHAGEALTGVMSVLDGSTRNGPNHTTIDLVTLQFHYTNQQDQLVLVATTRLASRN